MNGTDFLRGYQAVIWLSLALGWLASTAYADDCDNVVPVATIESHMDAAEARFKAMDAAGFSLAATGIRAEIECMEEIADPELAARIHTLLGLDAFLQRDLQASRQAFAAARLSKPGWTLSTDLVPAGNPLHEAFQALDLGQVDNHAVTDPGLVGAVFFDGNESLLRNEGVPTLFQRTDLTGLVVQGAYLYPDDDDPTWQSPLPEAAPAPELPTVASNQSTVTRVEKERASSGKGARIGLLAGAGAAAVGAGVLYGLASGAAATYRDPQTDYVELDGLRSQANTLTFASAGAGVLAVGLGVGGALVGRF